MMDATRCLSVQRYPGRGILFGKTLDGAYAAAAYFLMGRSGLSRGRILFPTADGAAVRLSGETRGDTSLLLYTPVRRCGKTLIVANGDQSDTICSYLANGGTFRSALLTRSYEPDAPHFTPRVSGALTAGDGDMAYTLAILRKDPRGMDCLRDFYEYGAPPAGVGHLLYTYAGDGDPLPSFEGGALSVLLPEGDPDAFTDALWNSLDAENRVGLYVAFLPLAGGEPVACLRNKRDIG